VHHELHKRALHLAAEVLGGDEKLRLRLGASEGEFASWDGAAELPKNVFLQLVDIITGEEPKTRRR
jgi:hypothetical protein